MAPVVIVFRSTCYECMVLIENCWLNEFILRHVWPVLVVWLSFVGGINDLDKMHVINADGIISF